MDVTYWTSSPSPSLQIRHLLSRISVLRLDRSNLGWHFTSARGVHPESIEKVRGVFLGMGRIRGFSQTKVYLGSHSDEGPRQNPGDTKKPETWQVACVRKWKQSIWASPHICPKSWWWVRWTLTVGTELWHAEKPQCYRETLSSGNG